MPAMDLATAIDETERFLTVWRTGSGPDRGRLHDVGSVIIAASLDHDAPELTTTHLETLLNALHAARGDAPEGQPMTTYCGNPRHPDGPWHTAEPLPPSWQYRRRLRQWLRKRRHGCGCSAGGDRG